MSTIVLRSVKGSPLTNNEVDDNFDNLNTGKLELSGGMMSGPIAMGTNKITGLGDPTLVQDAATKNYVDTSVANTYTQAQVDLLIANATDDGTY